LFLFRNLSTKVKIVFRISVFSEINVDISTGWVASNLHWLSGSSYIKVIINEVVSEISWIAAAVWKIILSVKDWSIVWSGRVTAVPSSESSTANVLGKGEGSTVTSSGIINNNEKVTRSRSITIEGIDISTSLRRIRWSITVVNAIRVSSVTLSIDVRIGWSRVNYDNERSSGLRNGKFPGIVFTGAGGNDSSSSSGWGKIDKGIRSRAVSVIRWTQRNWQSNASSGATLVNSSTDGISARNVIITARISSNSDVPVLVNIKREDIAGTSW
jgi:hypothetical protein